MQTNILLIFIFSIIGILDTLYLIYHGIKKTDVKCLFFPKEWCRTVQYSKYSKTMGIPNSQLGFVMYVVILALAYCFVQGLVPILWLQGVIAFGFLFSVYFLYIQAFVLRAYCTWCVISAFNFTVMTIAIFLM